MYNKSIGKEIKMKKDKRYTESMTELLEAGYDSDEIVDMIDSETGKVIK